MYETTTSPHLTMNSRARAHRRMNRVMTTMTTILRMMTTRMTRRPRV